MSTLVTPSAKAHERVTGRWVRDIQVANRLDWFVYYAKMGIGSPIRFLLGIIVVMCFASRAGLELVSWSCAILTTLYIIVDRFSRTKEFSFFRIGADFFLLGFAIVGLVNASSSATFIDGLATIGEMRWVYLLYAFAYCWELFPGVNRVFHVMIGSACIASIYGLWQHFTGVDLLRSDDLAAAPVQSLPLFVSRGFFETPEMFGTLLAMVIPFPAAAFFLMDKADNFIEKWLPVGIVLLLSLAVFWTYRPGLWVATVIALVVTLLMQGRNLIVFATTLVAFFAVISFATYGEPGAMFENVQTSEIRRAEKQRAQINTQVELWQKNTWIGVGHEASSAPNYDPSTGNVYFHLLAQFGVLGGSFYLLFILSFLLMAYRIFAEIPSTHYWHRVLISGGLGSQIAFHASGLYWVTLQESHALILFLVVISAVSYVSEHYSRGLVSDDTAL